jgi:hypothetical protein
MTAPSFSLGSIPVGWNWSVPCAFNPSGAYQALAVDSSGNLNVNVQAGGGSGGGNSAAGTIGAAVPASGDYLAYSNAGGTLVGVSAATPLPIGGTSQGTIAPATAPTTMLTAGAVYLSATQTLTSGQSMALLTDVNGKLVVNAGTSNVTCLLKATAAYGATVYSALNAAASTMAANIKAAQGALMSIQLSNSLATGVWVRFFNSTSAPTAGSGTPIWRMYVPPTSTVAVAFDIGLNFSGGIGFTATGGAGDTDTTTLTTAGAVCVNVGYA